MAADPSRGLLPVCVLCVLSFLLGGCSLFNAEKATESSSDNPLKPLVARRDSVQLDILFVDRPIRDPLLGNTLWNEVDQIAGLPSETRTRLFERGWRVGHASSHPPRALEELLALSTGRQEVIDEQRRLVGRRIALASGHDFPIDVTGLLPELRVAWNGGDEKSFTNARCVLRARLEREQDGWVAVNFTPEIHHGEAWLRPVATAFQWTGSSSQEVLPLYDEQFSLKLNVGEMALITATDPAESVDGSLGQAFFRSLDKHGALQRLLLVRVADMRRMTPVYAE